MLRAEIDLDALPHSTPPALRRLLLRCLERSPRNRMRDIGEARLALADAERELAAGPPAPATFVERPSRGARGTIAVLGAIAVLALVALAWALRRERAAVAEGPGFAGLFDISPPAGATFEMNDGPVAISADGRRIAFALRTATDTSLAVRELATASVRMVPLTNSSYEPFWSPDGRTLGFFGPQVMRWEIGSDAPPVGLAPVVDARGGSWSPRGVILYAPAPTGTLMVVPAAGGTAKPATRLDPAHAERAHLRPAFLPDGRHFLYWAESERVAESALMVGDLDSESTWRVAALPVPARFAPPSTVLFLRGSALYAQELDLASFKLVGEARAIAPEVGLIGQYQDPAYSVSSNGVLAFHTPNPPARPAAFDRQGRRGDSFGLDGDANLDLSPDGTRLAINAAEPSTGGVDIWVIDLARRIRTRVTFDQANEIGPVWSTDGQRLFYVARKDHANVLRVTRASGVGDATDVLAVPFAVEPVAAFPDGRHLLVETNAPGSDTDLEVIDATTGARQPFVATKAHEESGRISPDGKLIAYQSNESGRGEIYVQPYPPTGERWQVSREGGGAPRWRGDGRELTYIAFARQLLTVAVSPGPSFGRPEPLFRVSTNDYVLSRDGQTILATATSEYGLALPVHVLLGWNLPPR